MLLAGVEVRRARRPRPAAGSPVPLPCGCCDAELEPWAATPYLQLALVEESAGDLAKAPKSSRRRSAATETTGALVVASRIETRRGRNAAAARSLARARALDPRSPLFAPG